LRRIVWPTTLLYVKVDGEAPAGGPGA